MARTTPELVRGILTTSATDPADGVLAPFITMANTFLNRIIAMCPAIASTPEEELIVIETWLAAHFYAASPLGQKEAGSITRDDVGEGVGRSYARPNLTGEGLKSTSYGQAVLAMDLTGCLAKAGKVVAEVVWLGTDLKEYERGGLGYQPDDRYLD